MFVSAELVPRVAVPSRIVSVPVGKMLPNDGVTWIVNVTDWPRAEEPLGLAETMVVALGAGVTVCVKMAEVLSAKLLSAAKTAVIECEPTINGVVVVKVACAV